MFREASAKSRTDPARLVLISIRAQGGWLGVRRDSAPELSKYEVSH